MRNTSPNHLLRKEEPFVLAGGAFGDGASVSPYDD